MNSDAIQTQECVVILAHMAVRRKWTGTRKGVPLSFQLHEGQVYYSVGLGHTAVTGQEGTLSDAVIEVNRIIVERSKPRPAGRQANDPDCRGQQPLVRKGA